MATETTPSSPPSASATVSSPNTSFGMSALNEPRSGRATGTVSTRFTPATRPRGPVKMRGPRPTSGLPPAGGVSSSSVAATSTVSPTAGAAIRTRAAGFGASSGRRAPSHPSAAGAAGTHAAAPSSEANSRAAGRGGITRAGWGSRRSCGPCPRVTGGTRPRGTLLRRPPAPGFAPPPRARTACRAAAAVSYNLPPPAAQPNVPAAPTGHPP